MKMSTNKMDEMIEDLARDYAKEFSHHRNEEGVICGYDEYAQEGFIAGYLASHHRIEVLEKQNEIMKKALSFYDVHVNNNDNFSLVRNTDDSEYAGVFPCNDTELLLEGSDSCNLYSGKHARTALAACEQLEKGSK